VVAVPLPGERHKFKQCIANIPSRVAGPTVFRFAAEDLLPIVLNRSVINLEDAVAFAQ
jgi:hypothetical protein